MNNENNQNNNPQEINNNQPVNPQNVSMGSTEQQVPVEQVVAKPNMAMDSSINQVPVEANQNSEVKNKSLGKALIILCILILGTVFNFLGNTVLYFIGIALTVVALVLSIIQIKKKSKLSIITLILALLLLIGNGVVIFLAYSSGNKKSDELTGSTYVAIAKGYLLAAESNMATEECNDKSASKTIYLSDFEELKNIVSPYGNKIDVDNSYIKIVPNVKDDVCEYEYSIYITDGVYSIGTDSNPVLAKDITVDTITSGNN